MLHYTYRPVLFHLKYIVNSKTRVVANREKCILEKGFTDERFEEHCDGQYKERKEGKRNK